MLRRALAVGLVAFALSAPVRAAGPYDDLLKHTPPNTNALVLIDVKGELNSPLAKAEQWASKGPGERQAGFGFVPRDADALLVASDVNLSSFTREFQIGIVKARNVPTMKEVAVTEAGSFDEIAGRPAVLSPRDAYFTTLSGSELVVAFPADRQATARYLKAAKAGKTGELTPFLKKAAESATGSTLTIAVDLEDAIDKNRLKAALPGSLTIVKTKPTDISLIAGFLAGVKGMTFSAQVTDRITASISLTFAVEPSRYRKILPDLLREFIEGEGMAFDGFDRWEPKFDDDAKTMTMSGPMTTADLARVLSLFAFPQLPGEGDPLVKGDATSASMTKRYMDTVINLVNDIKNTKDNPNYEKTATWHDRAAAQIEQLSRRGVDPMAVEAAFEAAKRVHAIAASLRGVPIDLKALESSEYFYSWSVGASGGGWRGRRGYSGGGSGGVETNIPQIQAEIAKRVADDKKQRLAAWSEIDRILGDVRPKLAEKYKTPF